MKFKKITSMMLASVMAAGSVMAGAHALAAGEMPFKDVKDGDWFYDTVKDVYENELMLGVDTDLFEPNGSTTRAMFITVLGRMFGEEEEPTNAFPDAPTDQWYSPYVGWAVKNGILNGYEDGTLRPEAAITRAEMAAAMARCIDAYSIRLPRAGSAPDVFADADKIAEWAAGYIETLRRAGITNGDESKNYSPDSNLTRAEMARIILNLMEAKEHAYQGYVPAPAKDGYAVYGANYLYTSGTAVSGGLGTSLSLGGAYPALAACPDAVTASYHGTPANSTGVCTSVFEDLDLRKTPVVKICYSYDGYTSDGELGGRYIVNPSLNTWSQDHCNTTADESFTFAGGSADEGFATATFDLTSLLAAHSDVIDQIDLSHVLAVPFPDGYSGGGKFLIRYIGFFPNKAAADEFTSKDQADYLKNYFLFSPVVFEEATDSMMDESESLMRARIKEILSSESVIDEKSVASEENKCYYVSSIHGDDSNDGLSPDKPLKTLDALYRWMGNHTIKVPKVKAGDVVLFERGSEFYPKQYNNDSMTTLSVENGVSYGAYGEGPKPAFYMALDFTDKNDGSGVWLPTDYENIWVLDEIDPNDGWRGKRSDIGNIIFNGGAAYGIRVVAENSVNFSDEDQLFGVGRTSVDYGLMSADGKNYFHSGGTSLENPGTALKNNYEFIHDFYTGKLYLYWDGGNPGECFDDIKCSRAGYIMSGGGRDTSIDNLAIKYSSTWGAAIGGENLSITNCEVGYVSGSLASIESGFEHYGKSNGTYISNSYFHDIGDGPISLQSGDTEPGNVVNFEDATIENNVIVACGNGVEIWNKCGPLDENYIGQNKIKNVHVVNNIMGYIGYGTAQRQEEGHRLGTVICTSMGEMIDCSIENNLIIKPAGDIGITFFSSDTQNRGWSLSDNTVIFNPAQTTYTCRRDCFNNEYKDTLAFYGIRVTVPLEKRYIDAIAALGIGVSEKYYRYDAMNEYEKQGSFYMTGYMLER